MLYPLICHLLLFNNEFVNGNRCIWWLKWYRLMTVVVNLKLQLTDVDYFCLIFPHTVSSYRIPIMCRRACFPHQYLPYTVRCRYKAVNFLQNLHNRHPITLPWGRGKECLLWFLNFIHFLPQVSQCRMQYRDKLDRVLMILDYINIIINSYSLLWWWIEVAHEARLDTYYLSVYEIFNVWYTGTWLFVINLAPWN